MMQPDDIDSTKDFNCTIQELKRLRDRNRARPGVDFNCTIQELKPGAGGRIFSSLQNFNCTIQELKPSISC